MKIRVSFGVIAGLVFSGFVLLSNSAHGRERENATAAVMLTPVPGSTLLRFPTFDWDEGSEATQYWLQIGTTGIGSSNIWNQNQGTATNRQVSGMPENGIVVYVRLWSYLPTGWAYNDYTYTAWTPACITAPITSPEAGSTLSGTSPIFRWNAGASNTEYWLGVGTTSGGTQILNESQGTNLTRTVTGIPIDGSAIYVRLWSYCNGWSFIDYAYTAQAPSVRAQLTSPANNAVLAGASATFTWSEGTGSSQYWLSVGSAIGDADIWNENQGTALTGIVSGIPVDGRRVYVRIWSMVSGVWYSTDYDLTASGTSRARLSSPADGSILPSNSQSPSFHWSAGTASTQYWVYVGDSLGSSSRLSQNRGTSLTVPLSDLPSDHRPIYLRLWSLVSGQWVYNDHVFRANDGGARMTSPWNGSVLVGTSPTFGWSTRGGVVEHWLYVGDAVGTGTYHSASTGTGTTATVAGLPANGTKVYVRLWSLVSDGVFSVWIFNDYEYFAAP